MKKNKIRALIMIMSVIVLLAGCKETPEESAVVSKASGLSEEFIDEPLKEGEIKSVDIPAHWSKTEKKSNDRVTISADVEMEQVEIGNLPVLEMKNYAMTQKRLKEMAEYFAGGEELYVPLAVTKETYQKTKDRIDKKEGGYADMILWPNFQKIADALEQAIELAPEKPAQDEKAEIKFQKKRKDEALEAAKSWSSLENNPKKENAEVFFFADVGKDRLSHIEAECYAEDVGNSSTFKWMTGSNIIDLRTIQREVRINDRNSGNVEFSEAYRNILNQFSDALEKQSFTEREGQKQAEQLFAELSLPEMKLLYSDKILWFPQGSVPEMSETIYTSGQDTLWQADLEKASAGYEYTFTRNVGGLSAEQRNGIVMGEATKSYTPPFPLETVLITVTEDGVKSFLWRGMCEEVSTVTENIKLLPFEDIQNILFDQIFYWYSRIGQPAEDTTAFNYKVSAVRLGYSYVTAFDKPANAWMVPAWFFEVTESSGTEGDMKDSQVLPIVVNAIDGGIIG